MNVLLLFSIVIKLSVWSESQFFSIRFFFLFTKIPGSRFGASKTLRRGRRWEGRGKEIFIERTSYSRSFYRSRGIFSRHARDFVVREDLLRVACELNSTHTRYFIPYRETLARQFSRRVKARPTFSATFSSSTFSYAEAIRYQNIFERLNNLFHREEKKMISSILSEIILPRESLFEVNYLFIKIFIKRYLLMIFFFHVSRQYGIAKNLFDDRCLLTSSGMDACFKIKIISTITNKTNRRILIIIKMIKKKETRNTE